MVYKKIEWTDISVEAEVRIFSTNEGLSESHVMIQLVNSETETLEQFKNIETGVDRTIQELNAKPVWKRYFLSDAINQKDLILKETDAVAISIVQQPPLNSTKVALWLYLVSETKITPCDQGAIMKHSAYEHYYHTSLHTSVGDEEHQTETIFNDYKTLLRSAGCTLLENCVRTWIFVYGVDIHYPGMVAARKRCFDNQGLTFDTHFVASTGIEGRYMDPAVLVCMDAYAVKGLLAEQIKYLKASTHLNPTYEYGVTFERGTVVSYGDRNHIFISGTASINNKGEIEHLLDIHQQARRIFDNIEALLAEADAQMDDVVHFIVYLRDSADYSVIHNYMKKHYTEIPTMIVWAPICRPGWLIEVECMAIKAVKNPAYPDF